MTNNFNSIFDSVKDSVKQGFDTGGVPPANNQSDAYQPILSPVAACRRKYECAETATLTVRRER